MADFIENQAVKSAVRQFLGTDRRPCDLQHDRPGSDHEQPLRVCLVYDGRRQPPARREDTRDVNTAKFVYGDVDAKRVGAGSENYNTIAGFNAGVAAVQTNTANVTAHGGTISRNPGGDTYAVTLKCHDPNGELNDVSLSRDRNDSS